MKQRFSSLDVKVIAHELSNSLCSLRLANVYDLSSRIFLLKFAKPGTKHQVILDSGFRCHLTRFTRAPADQPSAFVTRLRKYLKTRRVTAVRQIGTDRIIEFEFGDGLYRLFLEFYAGGNVVLTDRELNVLAVLRIVSEGEGGEVVRAGVKYGLENRQNYPTTPELTRERVKEGLARAVDKKLEGEGSKRKGKSRPGDALRKALAVSITELSPMVVEHCLLTTKFDLSLTPEDIIKDDASLDDLLASLKMAESLVKEIMSAETIEGYIIAKPRKSNSGVKDSTEPSDSTDTPPLVYDDFHPFQPAQFLSDPNAKILPFSGFNSTVDEFFSSIEGQKLEGRLAEREEAAKKKLLAAKRDQQSRLGGLQELQELNERKAQAIEANVERVEEAIGAINGLLAQGMDWVEMARLLEMEQARGNPVANTVKLPLKLYENTITLALGEPVFGGDESDEGDETDSDVSESDEEDEKKNHKTQSAPAAKSKTLSVDVDLALSPWANARQYYDNKRSAAEKEQKTLQSSSKALKSTERKVAADLKKGLKQEKDILRPVRNQHWFEKFFFFVSSDGYLVLSGKDAQQNEMLYRRHLKRGDVYVNADLAGAATVIIKNRPSTPDALIPPSTLSQAGNLSVAISKAWETKAVMSAWWANANQVTKLTPQGDYLPVGEFLVKGKKNFLPPAQLLLGFGVLFQISEESKVNHTKHRVKEDIGETATDKKQEDDVEDESEQGSSHDENDAHEALKEESEEEDEDFPDVQLESDSDDEKEGTRNPLVRQTSLQPSKQLQFKRQDLREVPIRQMPKGHEENLVPPNVENEHEPENRPLRERNDHSEDEDNASNGSHASGPPSLTTANPPPKGTSIPTIKETKDRPPGPPKRGKRGKNKKLATKYANQDEEDRALAMALLGSAAAKEKASEEARAKEAREKELAFQKQRRRDQHLKTEREGKEAEELRQQQFAGDPEADAEDEAATPFPDLDLFVGTPHPADKLVAALPVCAPWNSMGRYKYKAKLMPGAQKKGKVIKEILHFWVGEGNQRMVDTKGEDIEKVWPREMELIRGWRDVEVVGTIGVGKCRVSMPGTRGKAAPGERGGKGKRGGRGSKKK